MLFTPGFCGDARAVDRSGKAQCAVFRGTDLNLSTSHSDSFRPRST